MLLVSFFTILFFIESHAQSINNAACTTILSLEPTWTNSSNTNQWTAFGCGPNGQRTIPCVQGPTALLARQCLNSGNSAQNLYSINLLPLFFTHFEALVTFCHASMLPSNAGGTVRVTLTYNNSQTRMASVTLNKGTGSCGQLLEVKYTSRPSDVYVDTMRIEFIEEPGFAIETVTMFHPFLCTETPGIIYEERVTYEGVRTQPLATPPPNPIPESGGRITCPAVLSEVNLVCILTNDTGTEFVRVPSFLEPRGYFGNGFNRTISLRVDGTDLYIHSGQFCVRALASGNTALLTVASPEQVDPDQQFARHSHIVEARDQGRLNPSENFGENPTNDGFLRFDVYLETTNRESPAGLNTAAIISAFLDGEPQALTIAQVIQNFHASPVAYAAWNTTELTPGGGQFGPR